MKKRMLWIGLVLVLLALIGYFTLFKPNPNDTEAQAFVPKSAIFVIESNEPIEAWEKLSKSKIWKQIKGYSAMEEIAESADFLDEMIAGNHKVFSAIGKRKLIISAHTTGYKDYDFLYIVDAEKIREGPVRLGLIKVMKSNGFGYQKQTYQEQEVHVFTSKEDGEKLYVSFMDNHIVCSYTYNILKESIVCRTMPENSILSTSFSEESKVLKGNEDCTISINYSKLPPYLLCYMSSLSDETMALINSMSFSCLDGKIGDKAYYLEGKTTVVDSSGTFLEALLKTGNTKTEVNEVLSDQTAFMLKLGFDDFEEFYEELERLLKEKGSYQSFEANKNKAEKLLGINMKEDFLSWIGEEVALVQYEKQYLVNHKMQNLIAIKATDIDFAAEKLKYIENQIRKRTPIKFTTKEYKGYPISYLEIKGMFKLFFGKLFSKVEKPYYTFIDDYVLFSDDIKTLLFTIESYEAGNVLAKDDSYQDFVDELEKKSSAFAYISLPKYYSNFSQLLDADSWQEAKENREYITCFKHLGLVLNSDDHSFGTQLYTQFELEEPTEDPDEEEQEENYETVTDMEMFIIEHLQNNVRKLYHENGKLKLMAEVKNNKYHGAYYEYHENGNIKVKGKYRSGARKGTFKYYNEHGIKKGKEYY